MKLVIAILLALFLAGCGKHYDEREEQSIPSIIITDIWYYFFASCRERADYHGWSTVRCADDEEG